MHLHFSRLAVNVVSKFSLQMDGRNTETTRATPKEQLGNPEAEARSKRLYIGGCSDARGSGSASGLAESTSDTDLERYFGQVPDQAL